MSYSSFPVISKDIFTLVSYSENQYDVMLIVKCDANDYNTYSKDMEFSFPLSFNFKKDKWEGIKQQISQGSVLLLGFAWNSFQTKNSGIFTKAVITSMNIIDKPLENDYNGSVEYKQGEDAYEKFRASKQNTQDASNDDEPDEKVDWDLDF